MPIYEYRCLKCKARFEVLQRLKDKSLKTCEKCGGRLEKLISSPAIQFRGNGWYITDYAHKNGCSPAAKAGKSDSAPETGADKEPVKASAAPPPPKEAK